MEEYFIGYDFGGPQGDNDVLTICEKHGDKHYISFLVLFMPKGANNRAEIRHGIDERGKAMSAFVVILGGRKQPGSVYETVFVGIKKTALEAFNKTDKVEILGECLSRSWGLAYTTFSIINKGEPLQTFSDKIDLNAYQWKTTAFIAASVLPQAEKIADKLQGIFKAKCQREYPPMLIWPKEPTND